MSKPSTLESIFFAAMAKQTPADRIAYLDEACSADAALRNRVERMLAAQAEAGSFLETPLQGLAIEDGRPDLVEGPGSTIGPYKLLQQIGEGGMGVVFMAEQTRPIQRTVALKIIKPGMDTRQVIARFEAERQALAMMDHSNIAKVLDAGTTDSGRPYFVMELVKGVPITKYCDEKHLPLRERLELFVQVCQAVQHAHQKGIIHRDIKPNNVLVAEYDHHAIPKVIDFGVAKATAQKLTERTMFTEFGQVLGTMEYMSPEQSKFNQLDVDTRSDIYSLGVLLYELLVGSTPLDRQRLPTVPFDETLRMIREDEPPTPSTRLSQIARRSSGSLPLAGRDGEGEQSSTGNSTLPERRAVDSTTIAANRGVEPGKLISLLRGELDWIVMKALEKDRNRRYESAGSLARDIERYLHDEPVQACPPTVAYRLRKFLRRNKTAAAFICLLMVGIAALSVSNIQTRRNEQRAITESARAQAVSNFLLEMIFSPSKGWRIRGSQYTVREMLDEYAAGLGNQLADQPEVEAELRHAIGSSYLMLGVLDRAEPHLKRAIELRRNFGGPQKKSLARSLTNYGRVLFLQRRYDEAMPPLREALEICHHQGVRGNQPISVCTVLQLALAAAGRHDEAERVIQEAWAEMQGYDELPPEFAEDPYYDVTVNCANFAYYFATTGKQIEAAKFLHRATLAQGACDSPSTPLSLSSSWQVCGCDWETKAAIEKRVAYWPTRQCASPTKTLS